MIPRAEAVVAVALIAAMLAIGIVIVYHPASAGSAKDLLLVLLNPFSIALGIVVKDLARRPTPPAPPALPKEDS